MKHPRPFRLIQLILLMGSVLLFCSCAPAPSLAPSGALKTQLFEIKQQQQEQANQMQELQLQLTQLHQQLIAEKVISQRPQDSANNQVPQHTPAETGVPLPVIQEPFTFKQEVVNVAASASSYLAAFSNLAAGDLSSAEVGFQNFLRDFPEHQYSPNARYWLAMAQKSQNKNALATANFQQIIMNPNTQSKAPAALVQLAQIYQREGLQAQSDNVLEQLRNNYPESPEAQQIYRSSEPTQ